MPLSLSTTPGVSANAYADLESVQALAAYRGASGVAFLELTADQQVQAIATAAAEIDSFVVPLATLAGAASFPLDLVKANQELAIVRAPAFADGATGDPTTPVIDRVKRDRTGELETEYFAPATMDPASIAAFPPVVQRLVARWQRLTVASNYGSSTAVRGA
jgi:hypothetical protein